MNEDKTTLKLAAEILERVRRGDTLETAVQDLRFDNYKEDQLKDAVEFLIRFLAEHTYLPSFRHQIGIED